MKAIKVISAGTGADLNIGLGFKPDHVKVINVVSISI